MQDLCPLCLQNDRKSKIKLLQINLDEAIWSCESEKCVWPFGHENLTYFSRKVGKTWSYHWDDYSPKNPIQHGMTLLKEQPAFPIVNDKPNGLVETKDITIKAEEHSNCNLEIKHENLTDTPESSSNTKVDIAKENCTTCKNSSVPETDDLDFGMMNDSKENIVLTEDSEITCIKEENKILPIVQSSQNYTDENNATTRGFPQITKIEKTNIDISNLLTDSQVPIFSHSSKAKPIKSDSKKQNLQTKPVMYITVDTASKTNANVTTKITKVPKKPNPPKPQSKQINQLQRSTAQLSHNVPNTNTVKGGSLKALKAEMLQSRLLQPIKKLSSGKGYEKFSFSVIKKQLEKKDYPKEQAPTNNLSFTSKNVETTEPTISRSNIKSEEISETNNITIKQDPLSLDGTETNSTEFSNTISYGQPEAGLKNVPSDTESGIKSEQISAMVIKSEFPTDGIILNETNNSDHQFNTSLDCTSTSIDIVIDDLLNIEQSISENISDDWITSLLI